MRITTYLNITETEIKRLDTIIERLGFSSRTEYFTACVHVTLYGKSAEEKRNPDPFTTAWIETLGEITDRTLFMQETFIDILHELAFPVIAARGGTAALTLLADDIRTVMLERCDAVPTTAEMEEWTKIFENIFRSELISYRTDQYRTQLSETLGGEA